MENLAANFVGTHAVGTIVALPEMKQPRRFTVPLAQTLARYFEVVTHVWMENKRQSGQPTGGYLTREVAQIGPPGSNSSTVRYPGLGSDMAAT